MTVPGTHRRFPLWGIPALLVAVWGLPALLWAWSWEILTLGILMALLVWWLWVRGSRARLPRRVTAVVLAVLPLYWLARGERLQPFNVQLVADIAIYALGLVSGILAAWWGVARYLGQNRSAST